MTIDELEEILAEVLGDYCSYEISTDKKGKITIKTSLVQDEDGELSDYNQDYEESEFNDEDNFEPFEEDEDEDE